MKQVVFRDLRRAEGVNRDSRPRRNAEFGKKTVLLRFESAKRLKFQTILNHYIRQAV